MISVYLTILIIMLIIRVFWSSIYFFTKQPKKPLTDKERGAVGMFWLMISIMTVILFLKEIVLV